MDKGSAMEFAKDWVDSWNSHDIDRILEHYTDDFEMNSPVIALRMGVESGKLIGKESVRAYWAAALQAYPELRFEIQNVYVGIGSVTIQYSSSVSGLASETFVFNDDGKVKLAYAMYE